jgi:hypothetical protein
MYGSVKADDVGFSVEKGLCKFLLKCSTMLPRSISFNVECGTRDRPKANEKPH